VRWGSGPLVFLQGPWFSYRAHGFPTGSMVFLQGPGSPYENARVIVILPLLLLSSSPFLFLLSSSSPLHPLHLTMTNQIYSVSNNPPPSQPPFLTSSCHPIGFTLPRSWSTSRGRRSLPGFWLLGSQPWQEKSHQTPPPPPPPHTHTPNPRGSI